MSGLIVRPTTCPQWDELREKFSVVVTSVIPSDHSAIFQAGFPSGIGECGYLGRVIDGQDIVIADAFTFQSSTALIRDNGVLSAKFAIGFSPLFGIGIDRVVLSPNGWHTMYRLCDAPEIVSHTIRESLVKAWDMRETLRSRSAALSLVTP